MRRAVFVHHIVPAFRNGIHQMLFFQLAVSLNDGIFAAGKSVGQHADRGKLASGTDCSVCHLLLDYAHNHLVFCGHKVNLPILYQDR